MYIHFVFESVCEHLRVLFSSFNNELTWIDIIFQFQLTHVFFCAPLIVHCTRYTCTCFAKWFAVLFVLFFHCCLFCIHKTIEFIWNSAWCCLIVFFFNFIIPVGQGVVLWNSQQQTTQYKQFKWIEVCLFSSAISLNLRNDELSKISRSIFSNKQKCLLFDTISEALINLQRTAKWI